MAREEWFPTEHSCEHIADGPHINGAGIFLEGEYDLQGTVPSSGDIFGHEGVVWCVVCVLAPGPNEGAAVIVVGRGPGQASKTKVAELRDGKTRRRAGDDAP